MCYFLLKTKTLSVNLTRLTRNPSSLFCLDELQLTTWTPDATQYQQKPTFIDQFILLHLVNTRRFGKTIADSWKPVISNLLIFCFDIKCMLQSNRLSPGTHIFAEMVSLRFPYFHETPVKFGMINLAMTHIFGLNKKKKKWEKHNIVEVAVSIKNTLYTE